MRYSLSDLLRELAPPEIREYPGGRDVDHVYRRPWRCPGRGRVMVDVDVHGPRLLEIKDLPSGSGWGTVPTPVF